MHEERSRDLRGFSREVFSGRLLFPDVFGKFGEFYPWGIRMRKEIIVAAFLALAQAQMARSQAANSSEPAGPPPANRIYVDEKCRIYDADPRTEGSKQHVSTDIGICNVDDYKTTYREETDDEAKHHHRSVTIREHTFLLHNPTSNKVTFVVDQAVPKGWGIDSDPQPDEVTDGTAVFLVVLEVGETAELRVAERRPPK